MGKHVKITKLVMELKFFQKNMLLFYVFINSMFYNDPLLSCQKWWLKDNPMINSNSNGDENYVK
jgi:hypothetical protein